MSVLACAVLLAGPQVAHAAFSGVTSFRISHSTAATFPGHPDTVREGTLPVLYHRMDDAQGATEAIDSSTHTPARPGTYHGASAQPAPLLRYGFEDGSGTAVRDVSGSNDGKFAPDAGWVTPATNPAGGGAGVFDGTRYVTSGQPTVRTDQSFTVSAWVRAGEYPQTSWSAAAGSGSVNSPFRLEVRIPGPNWAFVMTDPDTTSSTAYIARAQNGADLATTKWTHVVGVYDASTRRMQLYVDGALQTLDNGQAYATYNGPDTTATDVLNVGRMKRDGSHIDHWRGNIDEVRLYQQALTATQVSSLYSSPTASAPFTNDVAGAIAGSPAVRFHGTSNASNDLQLVDPQTFSMAAWVRTATTRGGHVLGFSSAQTGHASNRDRAVFMRNDGRLVFHIREVAADGTVTHQQATTSAAYNDGAWHHLVATFSPTTGMHLYVDGALQGRNTSATSAEAYSGYVRWGGDNISTWTQAAGGGVTDDGSAADKQFRGDIDEVAWFDHVLTAQKVAHLYYASF